MRHNKRKHKLGVSGPHRVAMMGNLMTALITHGRIETTISKARALRPVIEKIITLAKKAEKANDAARKLHYRRLAIARVRDKNAVAKLFDELVSEFTDRNGGYTRIYKLGQRIGDAAEMGLIEFVDGNDEGYSKKPKKKKNKALKGCNIIGTWKIEMITMGDLSLGAEMLGDAAIEFTETEMKSTGMGTEQTEPYKLEDGYILGENPDDKMKIESCSKDEIVLKGDMGEQEGEIVLKRK